MIDIPILATVAVILLLCGLFGASPHREEYAPELRSIERWSEMKPTIAYIYQALPWAAEIFGVSRLLSQCTSRRILASTQHDYKVVVSCESGHGRGLDTLPFYKGGLSMTGQHNLGCAESCGIGPCDCSNGSFIPAHLRVDQFIGMNTMLPEHVVRLTHMTEQELLLHGRACPIADKTKLPWHKQPYYGLLNWTPRSWWKHGKSHC